MAKKTKNESVGPSEKELPELKVSLPGCEKVWSGVIARLRIYDQPATTGKKVFAYVSPGDNKDYIGYTDDPNMIHALFLARDNANNIQGYTNAKCRIEWIDY
ncbi:MAG: hypothetical protein HGA46_11400 [Chlorobiaceae bacterium]|nr:hypothetical protein [Chlorobiaceae bacterium]